MNNEKADNKEKLINWHLYRYTPTILTLKMKSINSSELNYQLFGVIYSVVFMVIMFVALLMDAWFVLKVLNKCHDCTRVKRSITIPQFLLSPGNNNYSKSVNVETVSTTSISNPNTESTISCISGTSSSSVSNLSIGRNRNPTQNIFTILCIELNGKLERINLNRAIKNSHICVLIRNRKKIDENANNNTNKKVLRSYEKYTNYLIPINNQTVWSNNFLLYREFKDLYYLLPQQLLPQQQQLPQQAQSQSPNIKQKKNEKDKHTMSHDKSKLVLGKNSNTGKIFLINLQKSYQFGYINSPNLVPYAKFQMNNNNNSEWNQSKSKFDNVEISKVAKQVTKVKKCDNIESSIDVIISNDKKIENFPVVDKAESMLVNGDRDSYIAVSMNLNASIELQESKQTIAGMNVSQTTMTTETIDALQITAKKDHEYGTSQDSGGTTSGSTTSSSCGGGGGSSSITLPSNNAFGGTVKSTTTMTNTPNSNGNKSQRLMFTNVRSNSVGTNQFEVKLKPASVMTNIIGKHVSDVSIGNSNSSTVNANNVDLSTHRDKKKRKHQKRSRRHGNKQSSKRNDKTDGKIDNSFLKRTGIIVKMPQSAVLDTQQILNKRDYLPCCCITTNINSYNYSYNEILESRKSGCSVCSVISFTLALLFILIDSIMHNIINYDWYYTTSNYEQVAVGIGAIGFMVLFYVIMASSVYVVENSLYQYSPRLVKTLQCGHLLQWITGIIPLSRTTISIENAVVMNVIIVVGYGYVIGYFICVLVLFMKKANQISKDLNVNISNIAHVPTRIMRTSTDLNVGAPNPNSDKNLGKSKISRLMHDMSNVQLLLFPKSVKSYSLTKLGCTFAVLAHKTVKFYVITGLFFVMTIVAMIFRLVDRMVFDGLGYFDNVILALACLLGLLMSLLYLEANIILYIQCCMPCHRCCLKSWLKRHLYKNVNKIKK